MSSAPGLDAGGAALLSGALLVSTVGSVYAAYRASNLPRIFNWVLVGSFALMLTSDALAFVPSFISPDPHNPYYTSLVIYDFILTLNMLASSIKTTCNLIRFDGVFRTILGAKFHYRSWMNHALVVLTILITILSITLAWVVDIYPFYHGGIQAPGLPPQFQGGVTGSYPSTIWVTLLDWIIAVMSLTVVRMLRSKWKVLREAMPHSSAGGSHVGTDIRHVEVYSPGTPSSQQSQQALLERVDSHTHRGDSHYPPRQNLPNPSAPISSGGNGQQQAPGVNLTKKKRGGPMTNDDKSERGVRIMYTILSLQVALPICVMPPFFIYGGGDLIASGVTGIFLRIYMLIVLEYMYTIGTVVKYTSKQAMKRVCM
ncbi:hypothetical protein BJ742DRAFT_837323 [Cladochytrium replicatum]|nr:hypothetical protein BJ742DRAFT_837323 [Cladochytrium replicatum]